MGCRGLTVPAAALVRALHHLWKVLRSRPGPEQLQGSKSCTSLRQAQKNSLGKPISLILFPGKIKEQILLEHFSSMGNIYLNIHKAFDTVSCKIPVSNWGHYRPDGWTTACKELLGWPGSEGSGKWTILYLEYSRHLSWAPFFFKIFINGPEEAMGCALCKTADDPRLGDLAHWRAALPSRRTWTGCQNGPAGTSWNSTRTNAMSCTWEGINNIRWCLDGNSPVETVEMVLVHISKPNMSPQRALQPKLSWLY